MPIVVFSVVLLMVFVVLTVTLVLFYKDSKYVPPPVVVPKKPKSPLFACGIDELADRIATEPLNSADLLKVVDYVAKEHKIPGKSSGKEYQHHLRFIYQFCLNENANGSTIARMGNTLKAVNAEYKRDIEKIEKEAVRERDGG